uniref:NADH dehydrogenase subunit 9 n=1 Tax=Cocconeiopsis kantsiensis TaxID=3082010 RepID=UPI00300128E5
MLLNCQNIIKVLPIVRLELYNKESSFIVQNRFLNQILFILKNHYKYNFKILTCISSTDYPENFYRFQIVYELLSLKFNCRLRVKILVDELIPVDSVSNIFSSATWWECEIWDMFGVFFSNQDNLTRLLTDYGFQGFPLRKDFPLSGFTESRYNVIKGRVVYENVELAQEYRTFEFLSPWEDFSNK